MARAQFWDQFNLSTTNLHDIWTAAQSRDSYLNDPFTFRGKVYDDVLALYRVDEENTEWWFEQYGTDITLDNEGFISGGTVTAIANWFRDPGEVSYYNSYVDKIAIDANAFTDAMISDETTDDLAIFQEMFRKSDSIRLSAYDDDIFGWTGHDTIRGGAGNDTIGGDAGADSLLGEKGDDVLAGGSGDDNLIGGRGKDTLTGDRGIDRFIFGAGDGSDRITDFEDGIDRIVITTGAESMADLTITETAAGTLVAFDTVKILLLGEASTAISASDFDFV